MVEFAMNSILNSGQPEIANAVLSQYSKDDLQTEESRIKVLAEIRHIHYQRNAIMAKSYKRRYKQWQEDSAAAETENIKTREENEGKSAKDKKPLRDAGPAPLKLPTKQLDIPSNKIAAKVDEIVDESGDNQLAEADQTRLARLIHESGKPKHSSGKAFRDWGNEASWIKHIGYEAPPLPVPSKDTTPQEEDSQDIADKGWDISVSYTHLTLPTILLV